MRRAGNVRSAAMLRTEGRRTMAGRSGRARKFMAVMRSARLDHGRAMAGRMPRAHSRRPVAGTRAGSHGRRTVARAMTGANRRAMRPRGRPGTESRAMAVRRRDRPVVVPVVMGRRDPERVRKHGEDEGRGVIARSYGHASRVDAGRADGNGAAHLGAVIIVGTARKGGAEQDSAEQGRKALHGRLLAKEGHRQQRIASAYFKR